MGTWGLNGSLTGHDVTRRPRFCLSKQGSWAYLCQGSCQGASQCISSWLTCPCAAEGCLYPR